jgi:hypothetical protein
MDNKNLGWGLLIVGVSIIFWAFFIFDTTVAIDAYSRVNNLGLLNDQRNYSIIGGIILAAGAFILHKNQNSSSNLHKQEDSKKEVVNVKSLPIIEKNTPLYKGDKSLSSDQYKIYLVKKYSIEKNEALGKVIVKDKLFNSIDEALSYADGLENSLNDEYKIYLVKKYSIEKNEALGKVIIKDKLFNSIDEALSYADGLEKSLKNSSNVVANEKIATHINSADFPEIYEGMHYKKAIIKEKDVLHFSNDNYGFIHKGYCNIFLNSSALEKAIVNLNEYGELGQMGLVKKSFVAIDKKASHSKDELDQLGIIFKEGKYFFENFSYERREDAIDYAQRKKGDAPSLPDLGPNKPDSPKNNSGLFFGIVIILLVIAFFFFLIYPANKTSNITKGGAIVPKDQSQNSPKKISGEFPAALPARTQAVADCAIVTMTMGVYNKQTGNIADGDKLLNYALAWGQTAFDIGATEGVSAEAVKAENKRLSANVASNMAAFMQTAPSKMDSCVTLLKSDSQILSMWQRNRNQ